MSKRRADPPVANEKRQSRRIAWHNSRPLDWLPTELWGIVISHLDQRKSRLPFLLVCSDFNSLRQLFDPTVDDNFAIKTSAKYGFIESVRTLLADERVDPTSDDNFAPLNAATFGHVECTRELIFDSRVNIWIASDAFYFACHSGQVEVVKLLLTDKRLNLVLSCHHRHLWIADLTCYIKILQLLLDDGRFDPTEITRALKMACHLGHFKAVRALLADNSVIESLTVDDCNSSFKIASANGCVETVTVLLSNTNLLRKLSAVAWDSAIELTNYYGHTELARLIRRLRRERRREEL